MATLHVHLDEFGNFVFSPKGSRFFIFTVVWTHNPAPLAAELSSLRIRLIKDGHLRPDVIDDLAGFHACDDPKPRRAQVLNVLTKHRDWNFAGMVIEKNRVNDTLYTPKKFYPTFLKGLLNFVLRGRVRPSTNQVLIFTDTLPMKSRQEAVAVNQTIRASCRHELNGKKFTVLHHGAVSNCWLQVADYCSWSLCRKWEFDDTEAYDLLRPRLAAPEISPMRRGDGTIYY
jgi:hypothetical protein